MHKTNSVDFSKMKATMLGYGRYGAAENMAIDEAMLIVAGKNKSMFMRFYDFDRSTAIYAHNDHADNLRIENLNGTDVSRRITGGDIIYIDDKTFSYSVACGLGNSHKFELNVKSRVDGYFGGIIAETVRSMVPESHKVELGLHHSIMINGRPVAGHAFNIKIRESSFLYHGAMAFDRWDADKIKNLLRDMDENDYNELTLLPSISDTVNGSDINLRKARFMDGVISRLPEEGVEHISSADMSEIISISKELMKEKYANPSWVFDRDDRLNKKARFCLLNYSQS